MMASDEQLRDRPDAMTRGARHAFIFLMIVTLVLAAISLFYTARVAHQSEARDMQINRNTAAIRIHALQSNEIAKHICAILPALEKQASSVERPDFVRLAHLLKCPGTARP